MEIQLDKEADEQQIKSSLKIHKAIIILLFSFTILFLIFIIRLTLKIAKIKDKKELLSSMIQVKIDNNNYITSQISTKQLNLNINLKHNRSLMIDTIASPDEYSCILSWVDSLSNKIDLCYKETIHGLTPKYLLSNCLGGLGLIVIIKTKQGHRFGGYLPVFDLMFTTRPFLFSLDHLLYFELKKQGISHSLPQEMIIQFGNDIGISINCTNNTNSFSYFPNDYGSEIYMLSDLIGDNSTNFQVSEVEVLSINDPYLN